MNSLSTTQLMYLLVIILEKNIVLVHEYCLCRVCKHVPSAFPRRLCFTKCRFKKTHSKFLRDQLMQEAVFGRVSCVASVRCFATLLDTSSSAASEIW